MNRILCFVSACLLLYSVSFARAQSEAFPPATDSVTIVQYGLLTQMRDREITGICILNVSPDTSIVGAVVNEFGVKAFDFTYAQGKAELLNVIAPLDKWYIRKALRRDFAFILSHLPQMQMVGKAVDKKRSMELLPDGRIIIDNQRYNITYILTPIRPEQ